MAMTLLFLACLTMAANAQQAQDGEKLTAESTVANIPVTWKNFVRAEGNKMFKRYVAMGGFGKFFHIRKPAPIDQQKVVRMNRDTIYSLAVFDLTTPVTITKPDSGKRYQSLQVFDESSYTRMVAYEPGTYTLTQDNIGTRYAFAAIRTLVDPNNQQDIAAVNSLQDQVKVTQQAVGTFTIPHWDQTSQDKIRAALKVLSATMDNYDGAFGDEDEVHPTKFLFGSATGWGGMPQKDAMYIGVTPELNDGNTAYTLTVKDVPVDGFWSISLYNREGYFVANPYNAYSVNNITSTKNSDGSTTIHFGGDTKQSNFLPIMDGWNYLVRFFQPHQEILDGSWKFPAPQPVN